MYILSVWLPRSEIHLLELHGGCARVENGVVEHLHDFLSRTVVVAQQFLLGGRTVAGCVGIGLCFSGQPAQEFLVLLLCFKGVEDVGLFAEEAVDQRSFGPSLFPIIHLFAQ